MICRINFSQKSRFDESKYNIFTEVMLRQITFQIQPNSRASLWQTYGPTQPSGPNPAVLIIMSLTLWRLSSGSNPAQK